MTENERQAFGKKVKHLMIDTGVKQRDIQDEVNRMRERANKKTISEAFISKIVNGDKSPTIEVLAAMSKCFKVTIDELVKAE